MATTVMDVRKRRRKQRRLFQKRPAVRGAEERNALVTQWLHLIPWIIFHRSTKHRACSRRIGFADAIQEGRLILMRAAELWEPGLGKFSTYATICVSRGLFNAFGRARSKLPLDPDGYCEDLVPDREGPREPSVDLKDAIANVFRTLTARERDVLAMRYGLFGKPLHTLEGCALALKVTRERVRQIELRGLVKIKHSQRLKLIAAAVGKETCAACHSLAEWIDLPCHSCERVGCERCVVEVAGHLRCRKCLVQEQEQRVRSADGDDQLEELLHLARLRRREPTTKNSDCSACTGGRAR